MFGDEPQTLPLARREPFNRVWIVALPHDRGGKSAFGVSSIGDRMLTHIDAQLPVG